ncbi:MAG TPA: site-specific integrase [Candidatus Acidoferrales bacterium]|nr:site-specific integrase [Candidatus Acidoferrales bacterium]
MSIFIRPCQKCAAKGRGGCKDRRGRKNCKDCKWRAVTPPKLGRKTLGVFNTREQAEAKLQEALVNHRRGFELLPAKLTVAEVVERYFRDGTSELSVTTLHRYRELYSIHGSALGKFAIADLRKAHVTALYGRLQREPRGNRKPLDSRTVLHLHRVLHRAFEWAVEQDILAANVFARVQPPKVKDADTRALTLDEAGAFFGACRGTKFEALFRIAALTGCRRGELAALKWSAVDLEAAVMMVRAAMAETRANKAERLTGAASIVVKGTKSGKARQVPLDTDAVAVLRGVKASQAAEKLAAKPGTYLDHGFVFSDAHGRPIKLSAPTKAFREIANLAELPEDVTLHSLRHSFASWSLANGGDITAVQRCLGHSKASTTLNLYAHAVEGGREKAVRAVSETLRRAQAGHKER